MDVTFLYSQTLADALYVHIPFCPHKCFYCDFNSYVVEGEDPVWKYLYALDLEMASTVALHPPQSLKTIFFGGGTPSILTPRQIEYLFQRLDAHFPHRDPQLEMTMEANPGTVDREKLQAMRAGGVNRLSFGAQTFNEQLLRDIGRIHSPAEVAQSIELARACGFDNLSIDLMFGLPGQTMAIVEQSVQAALAFDLPHVSLYGLKIEENTLFHSLYMRNELLLPDEEEELEMYRYIIEQMRARGYQQYEVSNFAKPGYESRHNTAYWKNHAYYGLGAGAHGYLHGVRHVNVKGVQAYIEACQAGLPRLEQCEVTREEAMEDFMMVGLRMLEGVRAADFARQFGMNWEQPFGEALSKLTSAGLLMHADDGYRLTERGLYLGNEVFGTFLRD